MGLRIHNLTKTYFQGSDQIQVLKGIQTEIQPSEIVAIRGQSGSGKSTLLSLLAGLDHPSTGEIWIDQVDITKLSQAEMTRFRAEKMAFVFQQFHLMSHLSALENVMLALEIKGQASAQTRATEVLMTMNLGHRLNHYPSQLSGGECQRVAIARALAVEPQILFADEPSGNLDIETGRNVMMEFFSRVRDQKVTTVVVTHSEEVAQMCDRSMVISNGLLK